MATTSPQAKDLFQNISGTLFSLPEAPKRKEREYLQEYRGFVYACVSKIAHEMSSIGLRLFTTQTTVKGQKTTEIFEHPSLSLLHYVNDYATFTQLMQITSIYLELTGEAYWALLGNENGGLPRQIWVLRPDWVRVIPSPTEFIDHYEYRPFGVAISGGVKIPKEQMVAFKWQDPLNQYRGLGSVEATAISVDIMNFLLEWNRNFFYNAAMPSIIFTSPNKLRKEEIDRFLTQWRNEYAGYNKAHKIGFLGGGLTPTILTQSVKDMDFRELKDSVKDDILAAFGMPKTMLGLTEDVNRATADAAKQVFAESCLKPRMVNLVTHLNEFYLKLFDKSGKLFYDFDDPAPEDVDANLRVYENALKYGWMTINEVRERENMEPLDGGDTVYLPFGMTPLNQEGQQQPNQPPQKILGIFPKKGYPYVTLKGKPHEIQFKHHVPIPTKPYKEYLSEDIVKNVKSDLIRLVSALMVTQQHKDTQENDKETYWKTMVKRTDEQEKEFKHHCTELFNEQKAHVLASVQNLRSLPRYQKKAIGDIFDMKDEIKRWLGVFKPFVKEIVIQRGGKILADLGVPADLNLTTEAAARYLETDGLSFIKDINETTKDQLKGSLAEGLRNEESIGELTQRVEDIYAQATTSRAERISRTEVLRSTNFATNEAYRQSNVVEKKEWLTAFDERTCPECEALNGTTKSLDESFEYGVDDPPLHPNCRCTITPVLTEKMQFILNTKKLIAKEKKLKARVDEQLTQNIVKNEAVEKEIEKNIEIKEKLEEENVITENTKQDNLISRLKELIGGKG